MQKRKTSRPKIDTKLRFRLSRGIKLDVNRSGLSITVSRKTKKFGDYVNGVLDHFGIDPFVTDLVDIKGNNLLPTDAPIPELAEAVSALVASLRRGPGYPSTKSKTTKS
jgi:hypothetical protein